ncbi:hypothetical protein [Hyphomonas pacifica]|uniref:Uncharacterized protein n=1 Tax=Hyphomonas pacifica TaxID=1280941 RepID=A0A8B2PH50_9PROT|nr:hypothetical protein [Hyphomonas pacifica]RAN30660.1 hypothetical protein HY3_05785 [Hyphomonas pacifica]
MLYALVKAPEDHAWNGVRTQIIASAPERISTGIGTFVRQGASWVHCLDKRVSLTGVPDPEAASGAAELSLSDVAELSARMGGLNSGEASLAVRLAGGPPCAQPYIFTDLDGAWALRGPLDSIRLTGVLPPEHMRALFDLGRWSIVRSETGPDRELWQGDCYAVLQTMMPFARAQMVQEVADKQVPARAVTAGAGAIVTALEAVREDPESAGAAALAVFSAVLKAYGKCPSAPNPVHQPDP